MAPDTFPISTTPDGRGLIWLGVGFQPMPFPDPDAALAYLRSTEATVQRMLADLAAARSTRSA